MNSLSVISILNEFEFICLYFGIATVSTQLNDFNYCYQTQFYLIPIICLYTVKWLQVLLLNSNYSIQQNSFICTQSYDSNVISIFQFRYAEFQVLLFNTYNSCQHYSFVYTQLNGSKYCYVSLTIQLDICYFFYLQLNDQTVLFKTIQLSISHLFAHSLNVKQFYLTQK